MKLTVKTKYLVFPVNTEKPMKKVCFFAGGDFVYEQDIRLDNMAPNFYAYLDVERFRGMELTLTVSPEMEITCRESDTMDIPGLGKETFRPLWHFTEKNGWHNDPNGLVRDAQGIYHMYYQLNPAEPRWGSMHWGHATSPDMLHWTQQDIALFPDTFGTMYSGSGYLDRDGAAGFGKNALIFCYTAAGGNNLRSAGKPFSQCMAYSTDNGVTLHKYKGNPVIPHRIGANRDPKMVWCPELSCYLIALYLDGNDYALYSSDNLKEWTFLQQLTLPGDAECPDFYPLTADDGTRHWVYSGASAKYLVGTIDREKRQFVPSQAVRTMHTGSAGYAAQTYQADEGERRINIAWDRISFPGMPFCSQMGLPVVHTLRKIGEDYVIWAEPAEELHSLRSNSLPFEKTEDGAAVRAENAAMEFVLRIPAGENVSLTVLGQTFTVSNGMLVNSTGGIHFSDEQKIPLFEENGFYTVRMFTDVCSAEVFTGDHYACFHTVFDDNQLSVTLKGEAEISGWKLCL